MPANQLWYGDNLPVLRRHFRDESVDLIYLDPPFNSNRSYNILFKQKSGQESQAQIEAFDDTWTWSSQAEKHYEEIIGGEVSTKVVEAMEALRRLLGTNDVLAYLVNMTVRLIELHRVLKSTGSLYLHCDPTASHYLKIILDAIFGPTQFRSEVIWKRTTAHSDTKQGRAQHGRIHDVILFYSKGPSWTWNPIFMPYEDSYLESHYSNIEPGTGRRFRKGDLTAAKPGGDTSYEWKGVLPYKGRYWAYSKANMEQFEAEGRLIYTRTGMPELKRYLDEMPGTSLQDVWSDIPPINSQAQERLGYPTQKPVALLERIIQSSSNPNDVVLDPFCGCGTTIDAAERMHRQWVGIDITYMAIDLIRNRLRDTHGEEIDKTYEVHGIPRDQEGALALFAASPFDFERWAVSLVHGTPNQKQVGDRGIDGIIRFPLSNKKGGPSGRVVVSVKGGKTVSPTFVRDLVGTVDSQGAEMGLLITMDRPTKGVVEAAVGAGNYVWPINGAPYPKVQVLTVGELLQGKRMNMPTPFMPYLQAQRLVEDQPTLFDS